MGVPLYIVGATFDQVMQALTLATDAHDPFNFFSFCGYNSSRFSAVVPFEKRGPARSLVIAEKDGAAASYYAGQLRDRLRDAGLAVFITADLDEAIEVAQSDAVSVRESIPLTRAQWKALERIATETSSFAERGDNAGKPSWRTLLRRMADGELTVRRLAETTDD
jgi:hypothetical protein